MNNKSKKIVIKKLLKLLWNDVGRVLPARLWADSRPGGSFVENKGIKSNSMETGRITNARGHLHQNKLAIAGMKQ